MSLEGQLNTYSIAFQTLLSSFMYVTTGVLALQNVLLSYQINIL